MKVAILSSAPERAEIYAKPLRELPDVDLLDADSWDALFAARPDAVVVTGEADRRLELVQRGAEARARVLCEYPLAAKEADLRAMVDACDGVRLTFASPACHGEAFAVVRKGIADGVVGELTTVLGSLNTNVDGGTLGAAAPYLLDLADAVLDGEPAQQVYAQTNNVLNGQGTESAAVLTVRYRSGKVASFDCRRGLSATGWPAVTFVGDKASVAYDACPRLLGGFDAALGGARREPGGEDLYALMLKDFLGDGGALGPDGQAALRTARIVQAAYESAHTGQPVDLPPGG
ncbi:Gfo/Idh/MocA family oxidoreductase [Amycolatopsis sp. NPDC026612]|uniref:Gfo/Idh/MocA family protein n=1 Tax=Amycolatopsis sp. NPDC026612 TaxID=3155466 RepID=UPI0033ED17C2